MNKKLKNFLQNIIVMLISILILFFILETGTRIVYRGHLDPKKIKAETDNAVNANPRYVYENDSILGYRLKPNLKTDFFEIKLTTNSKGLRDKDYGKKEENVFRIIVLGDSFTFGWNVPEEDCYVRLLERILNERLTGIRFEVINCGIPGFGTDQQLDMLKSVGLSYEPDLVLVGLYVGNDVTDNLAVGRTRRTVNNGFLIDNILTEKYRVSNPILNSIGDFITDRSVFFALCRNRYNRLIQNIGYKNLESGQLEVFKKEFSPATEKGFKKTESLIKEIIKTASSVKADTAVITIPPFYQVYPDVWEKYFSSFDLTAPLYEPDKPNRVLASYFKKNGILAFDLLEVFSKNDDENLYHLRHWNKKGSFLAASSIADFLIENYFRNKSAEQLTNHQ